MRLFKNKGSVNFKKLQIGKPYTLIFSKDTLRSLKAFVYHPSVEGYSLVQLKDSVFGETIVKPKSYKEMEASGIIDNSYTLPWRTEYESRTYYLSDIYAWTIDFFRLEKGDRFKVIYTESFVDDTISVGISRIKAAYFLHRGNEQYAFEYETDSIKGIVEYLDQDAKNLRRAFLQSPIKFGRVHQDISRGELHMVIGLDLMELIAVFGTQFVYC